MKNDQRGFAALIIAITLVIILSLLTVGFAALMRHEQVSALNRQLSNAAYYAAESGINDANRAIAKGFTGAKTTCGAYTAAPADNPSDPSNPGASGAWQYLGDNTVDTNDGTSYPCLLINPYPSTLEYSSVASNQATTAVLTGVSPSNPDNNQPIAYLVVGWQDANGGTTFAPSACSSNSCFPPAGTGGNGTWPNSWSYNNNAITGVLRTAITPLSSLSADALAANTYTAFLYPSSSNGANRTVTYTTSQNSGDIVNGNCSAVRTATVQQPRYCNVVIDVSSNNQATYLLHLSSIYQSTRVTVTAFDRNWNQLDLKGAQTMIDSTGEAQGTLKRIQVREPVQNEYAVPEFDVETSQSICKLLSVTPTNHATGTSGTAPSGCGTL